MEKKLDRTLYGSYVGALLRGAVGLAVFLLLLLLSAALSEKIHWLSDGNHPVSKACLLIGAIVSGAAAQKRGDKGRMQHAVAGEAALLCLVAAIAAFSFGEGRMISFLIDCVLLLFGAFAGTMICGKRGRKPRGKR